ncbi:MAG: putative cytokinetic ring protein SteA [Vulcanibacillus sp.]
MTLIKSTNRIKSTYLVDNKTKNLISRLKPNQIAVINHPDIDEVAADGLIKCKPKAIINFSSSLTGKYPSIGLKNLLDAKIPVMDVSAKKDKINLLKDDSQIIIDMEDKLLNFKADDRFDIVIPYEEWNEEKWEKIYESSKKNLEGELEQFIDNTLEYASREKNFVLKTLNIPKLKTKIKGKHVVVVVRGKNYKQDLTAIRSYIEDYKPVLIGVDGGADALIENGLKPNIIIGDMDSVSDEALRTKADIVVHAYPNGEAPGLKRINELGISTEIISSVGTSEDVAMLMAFEKKAEIIVALGAHSNMIDFLEKGRKGMASTLLVRMKIGTKLIDAKGVSMLYQPRVQWGFLTLLSIAAVTPVLAVSLINKDMVNIFQIVWMNIKMLFT